MAVTSRSVRRLSPIYVIPGSHPGLVVPGNINLWTKMAVRNRDGSFSTVRSASNGHDVKVHGKVRRLEVLFPTVLGNPPRVVSVQAADAYFLATGQHLGMFTTPKQADRYATALHNWYVRNAKFFPVPPRRR